MFEILRSLLNDSTFKTQVKHETKNFNANQKILLEGKPHTNFYLIKNGKVRVSVTGEIEGKQPVHPGIMELGPDDVFGEFGIFDSSPASADVIAISDIELIEVDIQSFKTFLEANPQIGYKILLDLFTTLVTRLKQSNNKVLNLFKWGIKAHQMDKYLE